MTTLRVSHPIPSRLDRSIYGILLVAVALAAVGAIIFLLWLRITTQPPFPSERYFPVPQGATFTYRITQPDGSILYRARNVRRQPLDFIVARLTLNTFNAALAAAHVELDSEHLEEAIQQLHEFDAVQLNEVEYNARGDTTRRGQIFALLTPERLEQFGVDEIGIAPPLPLIPASNDPPLLTGTLNGTIPYTATFGIETRGAHDTEIGKLQDCIQVAGTFTANANTVSSHTWYCAGVGEVFDETTNANGTTRTEIVGASVGEFLRGSAPLLPRLPVFAALDYVFPQPLAGTLNERSIYREPGSEASITTNVLPVGETLLYGTQAGALVAVDRVSGQERWRFQTTDAIFSTPVVANGIVYFGSAGRRIYAVRMTDGAFVWAFHMKDIISSSPAIQGDTVYVSSEDRNVYALDADTGIPRWTYGSSSPFIAQPVLYENMLFVSNADGELSALDAATGTVLWQHSAPRAIVAPVTIQDGRVYLGTFSRDLYATDRNVYALNVQDGKVVWSRELGDDVLAPIPVANMRAYVTTPQEIYAFDAATGERLWRYASTQNLKGTPLLLGNQLWILRTNDILGLDANTGAVTQQFAIGDVSVNGGLSSDGSALYIGFFDGSVKSYGGATP